MCLSASPTCINVRVDDKMKVRQGQTSHARSLHFSTISVWLRPLWFSALHLISQVYQLAHGKMSCLAGLDSVPFFFYQLSYQGSSVGWDESFTRGKASQTKLREYEVCCVGLTFGPTCTWYIWLSVLASIYSPTRGTNSFPFASPREDVANSQR